MKSRAPQLHLEYRFYKQLGSGGKFVMKWIAMITTLVLKNCILNLAKVNHFLRLYL